MAQERKKSLREKRREAQQKRQEQHAQGAGYKSKSILDMKVEAPKEKKEIFSRISSKVKR